VPRIAIGLWLQFERGVASLVRRPSLGSARAAIIRLIIMYAKIAFKCLTQFCGRNECLSATLVPLMIFTRFIDDFLTKKST